VENLKFFLPEFFILIGFFKVLKYEKFFPFLYAINVGNSRYFLVILLYGIPYFCFFAQRLKKTGKHGKEKIIKYDPLGLFVFGNRPQNKRSF